MLDEEAEDVAVDADADAETLLAVTIPRMELEGAMEVVSCELKGAMEVERTEPEGAVEVEKELEGAAELKKVLDGASDVERIELEGAVEVPKEDDGNASVVVMREVAVVVGKALELPTGVPMLEAEPTVLVS